MRKRVVPGGHVAVVHAENHRCAHRLLQIFANHRVGEGRPLVHRSVFGRSRRRRRERAVRFLPQVVFRELRALLQHRISHLGKKLLVACELIVLPQVRRQPVGGHRIVVPRHVLTHEGRGETEGVAADTGHPSAGVEIFACRHRPGFAHREDEFREWFGAFGQSRCERRPIVHLQVDVVVVVHAPRPVDVVVPHPLQVCGEIARSRRGDEQIAAKLEVERLEIMIRCAVAVGRQSAIRRQVSQRVGRGVQLQLHAIKERSVVLVVACKEGGEVASRRRFHPLCRGAFGVHAHIGLRIVELRIEVHAVVRVGGEEEGYLVGAFHRETPVGIRHRAAFRHRAQSHHKVHAIVVQLCAINQPVLSLRHQLSLGAGVRRVGKREVLLSAAVGGEAHHQHIVGVGDERAARVARAVGRSEIHRGQRRIERERALVVADLRLVESRCDVELTHRGERAEAKIFFAPGFVGRLSVEILACEPGRLFGIALGESTADRFEHRCARLVHIPVVSRTALHARTAAPEALFVEREAFGRHRAHEVRAQVAITQGQRAAFPLGIGVHGRIARTDGLVQAVKTFGVSAPPTFGPFEGRRSVESNDMAGRGLRRGRRAACEQCAQQDKVVEVHKGEN